MHIFASEEGAAYVIEVSKPKRGGGGEEEGGGDRVLHSA